MEHLPVLVRSGKDMRERLWYANLWDMNCGRHELTCEQLLTGATGSLGAFLLAQLVARADVEHVFCIARAPDDCTATERIKRTLAVRELEAEPERLTVFRGSLGQPDLGLDERTLHLLEANVDLVIHVSGVMAKF